MVELTLSEREQSAVRAVAGAQPVPGTPLLSTDVLTAIDRLLPSDDVGVGRANDRGFLEESVNVGEPWDGDPRVCDGPLFLGLLHAGRVPDEALTLRRLGVADALWLGCRNGPDHVVQLALARHSRPFSDRDAALLGLVAPWLLRLMRERPTPALPTTLTIAERRVLVRVAAGHSNAQVAEFLGVEVSTVRKHLEHAYRKLGVSSRTAAVARMQGRDRVDLDLAGRLERFA